MITSCASLIQASIPLYYDTACIIFQEQTHFVCKFYKYVRDKFNVKFLKLFFPANNICV